MALHILRMNSDVDDRKGENAIDIQTRKDGANSLLVRESVN